MKVAVIGCGYVGLVTAACFAELGHNVVAADCDAAKVHLLQKGISPVHERHLPELMQKHTGDRLRFQDSIAEAIQQAEVVFICVGTPSLRTGATDLSGVTSAVCEIARCLRSHLLIVEKSTVPARTCQVIRRALIRHGVSQALFSVASNPEFLREGSAVHDFLYPDRIVVGVTDYSARCMLQSLYLPLTSGTYHQRLDRIPGSTIGRIEFIETTPESAELIKHASNAFLAMKISFINAVANIAEAVGADIDDVRTGLGSDQRIGGAFLDAGIGYGGSCFTKDLPAFRAVAEKAGYRFDLLGEIIWINSGQRVRFLEKVRINLSPLRGKRIAVLGLAFKGGTDDIRESPAIALVRGLLDEGARVVAFDPAAMDHAAHEFSKGTLDFRTDPYQAMADADALLILTDWPEFAALDLSRVRRLLRSPLVLDGRNLYPPSKMEAAGLNYVSVGRSPVCLDSHALPSKADRVSSTGEEGFERHIVSSNQIASVTQELGHPTLDLAK
jgi:UDPglucose 6-dehydrogenase